MQTVFEPRITLPFDGDAFDRMKEIARQILQNARDNRYTEAIVLLSGKGTEYSTVIRDAVHGDRKEEEELLRRLEQKNDGEVSRILCMWKDGGVDIPSFYLRERLIALHPQNGTAGMFVQTKNGFALIPLSITMK